MKKVCLNLSESRALGDTLCSTPTIRKLYSSYNQKISLITHHKEIFKNNPYVDSIFDTNVDDHEHRERDRGLTLLASQV